MLEKAKLVPNWKVEDHRGETHKIWDFRQKSHLILIYEPQTKKDVREHWLKAIQLDRKQWDWLNATLLILADAPKEMVPGAYLIDRYGQFVNYFAPHHWTFDDLEKEFLYYEARHC
jgi:hypothetical protein